MKARLLILVALLGVASMAADPTTVLAWDPNDPADRVSGYIVQFRTRSSPTNSTAWSEVIVPAGPAPTATVPVTPFGTEFRLAAANSFGRSPWTETVYLPAAVRGLKLVLPLTP